MRICHVNLAKHFRGGERQTELLIRELAARGRPQRLVIRRGSPLKQRCGAIDQLEIAEVASNPLSAAFATRRCALVHAHEARGVYSAWIASCLYRIPYVITRRVLNTQRRSFLRDRAYAGAKAIVVISRAVAEGLEVNYPHLPTELVLDAHAELASDSNKTEEIRTRYAGKFLIGNVAALDQTKGQMTMIEAARTVRDSHPDWQFLVCGSGPDEQRLRAASADLDNFELLGFITEPGSYYESFDVFAFPSISEAVGSAMLDAMYFGLPIIASDVGGIPEYIKNGENGRLVEAGSSDQLVVAIEEIIANPQWAASVRAANLERAKTLGAATMAAAYEKIYDRAS